MTNSQDTKSLIQVMFVSTEQDGPIRAFINKSPDMRISAEAKNAAEALHLLRDRTLDIALLEFGKSDSGAIQLTREIRQSHPNIRVIIVTASSSPEDIFATLDAGADGYVLKENVLNVLEMAIRSVKLGAVWLDPGIAKQVLLAAQTPIARTTRVLPTGFMPLPLLPDENSLLNEVAASNCKDGVCLVDPSFIKKLKRFAPAS